MTTGSQPASAALRSRFLAAVQVYAVKRIESESPLDDVAANRDAMRQSANLRDRIFARADLLTSQCGLCGPIVHWQASVIKLALIAIALLVVFFLLSRILVGVGAESFNALRACIAALLPNALALLLYLIVPASWTAPGWNLFGAARGISQRLRLINPTQTQVLASVIDVLRSTPRAWTHAQSAFANLIWSLVYLLAIANLWLLFSVENPTVRATPLLGGLMHGLVGLTCWLPNVAGLAHFDTTAMVSGTAEAAMWANWLLACSALYGFLPRALIATWRCVQVRKDLSDLAFDRHDPYFADLERRFAYLETTERPPTQAPSPDVPTQERPSPAYGEPLAIGFELATKTNDASERLARLLTNSVPPSNQLATLGTPAEDRAVRARLSSQRPERTLLVCRGGASPDRAAARMLGGVNQHSAKHAILLTDAQQSTEVYRWSDWLKAQAMPACPVFHDEAHARSWLASGTGEAS